MPKWNIKKNYKKVFSKRFIFFDIGSDIINSIKNYEILINNGADINVQDNNGNTALHYAIYYKNYKLMELLINNGADVNVQDNNGNTALHLAIKMSFRSGRHVRDNYSDLLISHGANRDIRDNNGETFYSLLFGVDNNYR